MCDGTDLTTTTVYSLFGGLLKLWVFCLRRHHRELHYSAINTVFKRQSVFCWLNCSLNNAIAKAELRHGDQPTQVFVCSFPYAISRDSCQAVSPRVPLWPYCPAGRLLLLGEASDSHVDGWETGEPGDNHHTRIPHWQEGSLEFLSTYAPPARPQVTMTSHSQALLG